MISYQLTAQPTIVKRTMSGIISFIPNDPMNMDWKYYQEWLDLGNTPDPA